MIGFFGGSFDPVHFGHLNNAQQLKNELNLSELFLMPCREPVHKKTLTFSTEQRLQMLQIAIQDFAELSMDTREINRKSESYSIDSLKEIALEFPDEIICLIIGMDSFNQLSSWKDYQKFHQYCHVIVLARPGEKNEKNYAEFTPTQSPKDLLSKSTGLIYFAKTDLHDVSSSDIRGILFESSQEGKIYAQQSLDELIPKRIINYLQKL
ncbi:nicotinate (nicotinamide) nucleotide adenylyltransferase [Candidatus Thioglobus sp.]|nr:nicotinate (nicotinamide) nucleotide adenylyltransferase [Candidatus Thioglobus sp.]